VELEMGKYFISKNSNGPFARPSIPESGVTALTQIASIAPKMGEMDDITFDKSYLSSTGYIGGISAAELADKLAQKYAGNLEALGNINLIGDYGHWELKGNSYTCFAQELQKELSLREFPNAKVHAITSPTSAHNPKMTVDGTGVVISEREIPIAEYETWQDFEDVMSMPQNTFGIASREDEYVDRNSRPLPVHLSVALNLLREEQTRLYTSFVSKSASEERRAALDAFKHNPNNPMAIQGLIDTKGASANRNRYVWVCRAIESLATERPPTAKAAHAELLALQKSAGCVGDDVVSGLIARSDRETQQLQPTPVKLSGTRLDRERLRVIEVLTNLKDEFQTGDKEGDKQRMLLDKAIADCQKMTTFAPSILIGIWKNFTKVNGEVSKTFGDTTLPKFEKEMRADTKKAIESLVDMHADSKDDKLKVNLEKAINYLEANPYLSNAEIIHSLHQSIPSKGTFYQVVEGLRKPSKHVVEQSLSPSTQPHSPISTPSTETAEITPRTPKSFVERVEQAESRLVLLAKQLKEANQMIITELERGLPEYIASKPVLPPVETQWRKFVQWCAGIVGNTHKTLEMKIAAVEALTSAIKENRSIATLTQVQQDALAHGKLGGITESYRKLMQQPKVAEPQAQEPQTSPTRGLR
jgi:hypothetical protein